MDADEEYIEADVLDTEPSVWDDARNENWNDDIDKWRSAHSDKSYK